MDLGSAVVRIDVSDRALVEELLEFLRRCSCTVDRTGPSSLLVSLDPAVSVGAALSLVRAGVCYACTGAIEAPLARLGSALCLECRDSEGTRDGEPRADGAAKRAWARMEVEAYLRVWQARHPKAKAVLSELGPAAIAAAAR
jgi:hypothetical protein